MGNEAESTLTLWGTAFSYRSQHLLTIKNILDFKRGNSMRDFSEFKQENLILEFITWRNNTLDRKLRDRNWILLTKNVR